MIDTIYGWYNILNLNQTLQEGMLLVMDTLSKNSNIIIPEIPHIGTKEAFNEIQESLPLLVLGFINVRRI